MPYYSLYFPRPGIKIRLSLGIADKDTGEVCQIERDFQIMGILGDIESLRAGNISYVIFDKGVAPMALNNPYILIF